MEQKIDELLKQLHKYLFADSEQVVNELRIYILDDTLKEADLAFISSKIFNSKESFLEFLRQNAQMNDKLLSSVKKKLYELLVDFLKLRPREVSGYLQAIRDTCLLSFRSDHNSLVKEASLQLLIKLIEIFESTQREIEGVIKPRDLMVMLLDEIKLRRPSASVKGAIWNLVGLLHERYGIDEFRMESQDVMFIQLMEQMKADKPEVKAIQGIMKGFVHSLTGEAAEACTLDEDQLEGLFVLLKTAVQPIQDMQHKGVMKAGMKLLGTHIHLFKKNIIKQAIELVTQVLKLCVSENMEVRDSANDLLGRLMGQISEGLTLETPAHREVFRQIQSKFQEILEDFNNANILLISTIKAIGIFSKAILTFMGEDQLWKYLEKLVEVSEVKIIKEFEQQEDPKNDMKNFKQILKKQKQLLSFIESYSFILANLRGHPPSEAFLLHFYKVCALGVRHHRKLYPKYRDRFYEALAHFTMSLAHHKNSFIQWSTKFVRACLTETLKIPDAVVFGGESPFESLQDAVQFWREWLSKDKIWTEFTCSHIYDELLQRILEDIDQLNLTYSVQKLQDKRGGINNKDVVGERHTEETFKQTTSMNVVQYVANNSTDQQYLVRLSNFVEMFLLECKEEWFLRWLPSFCTTIVKKASQTPRISKLYSLLKTAMQIASKHKYFEVKEESFRGEKLNTYNMLLTFFKELIGKQEEYQDELLTSCLDLLLHVPISVLYAKHDGNADNKRITDNVYLWKSVMLKSLHVGHAQSNQLAMNSVMMLEQWFNALPMVATVELYRDILPKLSDFLHIEDEKTQRKAAKAKGQDDFQFQEMLKSGNDNVTIERKDIASKVLDLLGKIGGHAHSIINNEQTRMHEKENFIKWDPEKRLKFTVPLYTAKVDIYLDACLPKLVDLALNAHDRETRIAGCEFIHALLIYMIGTNATQPKAGRGGLPLNADGKSQEIAPYAKIYQKLFPVVIRLASETEQIARTLFEPLIFQIVRWFSSSRVFEHPEVESLLEALIDGASSRNNSALREMCSNAVAEFAKWSLKQMSDKDIKENPNNIKSLIRRIESNSNHPDPFKRLSAVLCFNKIFTIIRDFDALIDRFCLEITHCVLGSLKMCHNSIEFSQEVIDNCTKLLKQIQKVMTKKTSILMLKNDKRSIHSTIFTFILYLFEKFTSVETVCRRESMKLWEALVKNLTPKNSDGMPDNPRTWVLEYNPRVRGDKSIFRRLQKIQFEDESELNQNNNGLLNRDSQIGVQAASNNGGRGRKFSERQKQLDQLAAQLECFEFLISKTYCSYEELIHKLHVDEEAWLGNLHSFIHDHVGVKFQNILKSINKNSDKMYVCKEDKESFTKSKITLITQLFKYLISLDEQSLQKHLNRLESTSFKMIEFALQIILVPMIHQLQILVEDQELERQLRMQCELLITKLLQQAPKGTTIVDLLKQKILPQLRMIDLDNLKPSNVHSYPPKLLMQMCLGYLKLSIIDPLVKPFLIQKKNALTTVVEEWFQGESPLELDSSRVLVKFISKLEIPNQVLCDWLTTKYEVYQKTNDLLLSYIADNWSHEKLHVGEYLISKAAEEGFDKALLSVFLPILEVVHKQSLNYQQVLLSVIPREWSRPQNDFDAALNQVRIYSFITNNCKQLMFDSSNKLASVFIDHLCQTASLFLQDRFSVHLKKEVLQLIGLIYNMKTSRGEFVHVRLNDSIVNLQKHFFPMKSREQAKNSNEANNFNIIIEAFMNLLLLSKNLKVLRMLYGIIREPKTSFEPSLRRTLNIIVTQLINKKPLPAFKQTLSDFFDEFFDYNTDTNIDDNLRWAIMQKVIMLILETCSQEQLTEVMIDYTKRFEAILNASLTKAREQVDPTVMYMLVKEKTFIYLCFEVMFRRLKSDTIKNQVHKRLYGAESQGNEITKFLISSCVAAKRCQVEGFLAHTQPHIQSDFPNINSPVQVQRQYVCAAYSCLTAIIMITQTKESLFSNFLFVAGAQDAQSVWSLIVDTEHSFNFEVETNFTYVQLKNIELKIDSAGDMAQIKANNLITEYVNSSFMSANEKFNSAMVFETQPEKINIKSEDEKLQKFINEKNGSQDGADQGEKGGEGSQLEQMELDNVNQHECMRNIKRCIDKMVELFSASQWEKERNQMPLFMQALNQEVRKPDTHINVRIFILKILINNPTLFEPYAGHWFEPIVTYLTEKNNGGKGFHYFMRDLCTLLISWSHFVPEDNSKNRLLATQVVNTLVRYSADKAKMIFNTNIQIVASLLHRWRRLIAIGKDTLSMMVGMDDKKESSNLWKMTGIQILALAVAFDVPVIDNPETASQIQFPANQRCFRLQEFHENKYGDKLLVALLKIQENKKKQIIQAASETLGKILARQPTLVKGCLPAILSNEGNERHDVLVNSIEKISREYPELLQERKIFMKLLSFVKVLTGIMRSAVLKSLERYLHVCRANKLLDDINEISLALYADSDDILADISDENQQAYILLLTNISKLNIDSGEKLIKKVMPRLKVIFVANKNDYSRGLFYDLMVFLYDQFELMRPDVKSALIRGLSDKSKVIREKLTAFWSDPSRLSLDPTLRIQQLMGDMYVKEEEHIWLNNAVYLLMQISSQSSDYERKIFDQPLQNCKFTPLEINNYYNAMANLQRSQPLTPLFSQQQMMMIQASQQAAADILKKESTHLPVISEMPELIQGDDVEMIDTTTTTNVRQQFKQPQQKLPFIRPSQMDSSQVEITDSQAQQAGFIRSTQQIPIFTQTQMEQSSLIATNFQQFGSNSPPQQQQQQQQFTDSLTQSFYEINNKMRQQQQNVLNIQTGGSPPQDYNFDGNDDVFIAPQAKKKQKKHLSEFFAQNQYVYKPQESQGQRIRYVPQGSMPAHLLKQDEIRKMQREQFFNRQVERMKKSVGLYRKYRTGELPDIQINYKDVLLPLMALIKGDTTIATEIFVEVFSEIYKSLNVKETRAQLGDGVKRVLQQSILYDYGCINCMHRVSMELLKIDGFTLNAAVIQRTGQHSMSFQTALVLLEETIIHGRQDDENNNFGQQQVVKRRRIQQEQVDNPKKKIQIAAGGGYQFIFNGVSESNRTYWFNMINLYELIANDDALQGIWSFLADEEGINIFKRNKDNLEGKLSQDHEHAVNLIKEAHMLKNKGSIAAGLQVLEQALNDPKINEFLEDHIRNELQNKRLESKASLLKWDEIAKELTEINNLRQLRDIPYQHAEKMIKAQVRVDEYWGNLSQQVAMWQMDDISKAYLDKNFNYEMALIALTCKDFDRARFYIDRETTELLTKWRNLTKLTQIAQHILVQKIQKIYEMKEFLETIKNEGVITKQELIPKVMKTMQHWIQRVPSNAFDQIGVWDDILTARNLYVDLYNFRLKDEFQQAITSNRDLNDIRAILQVQCAKGSFKMGLYDCSDRYLKKALRIRKSGEDGGSNMKIVGPIIKLKSEQFKSEALNLSFQDRTSKLSKIIGVLESKMKDSFKDGISQDDFKTEIKGLLLRQQLEKKMLNIILDEVKSTENVKQLRQYEDGLNTYLGKTFGTLSEIFDKVKAAAQYDDHMKQTMAKTYFKFAQFTDKILRKMENESCSMLLTSGLKKLKKSEEELAKQTIKNGLLALNLEYSKASDIIPRLLDVLSKYKEHVEGDFIAYSKDTPAWFFLRWINQIVAIVNRAESSVIEDKVIQIARRYPQALYYPFKVIESNIDVNVLDSDVQSTHLFNKLRQFFAKSFTNLNSWIEALDCLVYPEHRFKYWFQILSDMLGGDNVEVGKAVSKQKLQDIVRMMMEDIAATEKKMVGTQVGSYNRKFAEKWSGQLVKMFGEGAAKIGEGKLTHKQVNTLMVTLNQKVNEGMGTLGQGYEKVSTFSEWLDSLDNNDFYKPYEYIEVPGQYESLISEPIVEKNVKIASVRKTLLILGSIRRPKRITVHGSNEKDYHLMIKGGEDLRLDQRVQQLFQIMNSIFQDDPACMNRDLHIKTFNVVPITNRLGSLEWVDNTEPLKSIINKEHMRVEGGKDLNQSRSLNERRKWLKNGVPGNAKKENIAEQHLQLLNHDEKSVVEAFNKHKEMVPWYLLRNGLENLCLTSAAFLAIKNQFVKSLATFSVASYLIGIGDRHLENFLVDTSDGEVYGIDFGIAFGQGLHLGIPELMPFRLTQQIEGVIAPHPLEGVYKQTMVHAMQALRKRKSLILDTCEIFVKEPLLDWVKDAKQKQNQQAKSEQQNDSVVDSMLSEYEEELQELAWYPRKKIEIVKYKLNGLNPVKILERELKESKHDKRPYIKVLMQAVKGPQDSSRQQFLREQKRYLEVDEQIDCLIEQARDPNILGRTWIGWSPYI